MNFDSLGIREWPKYFKAMCVYCREIVPAGYSHICDKPKKNASRASDTVAPECAAGGDGEQAMTNEEIICTFMEPNPEFFLAEPLSKEGWWTEVAGRLSPILNDCPSVELLGVLWEVQERLTNEQRHHYEVALARELNQYGRTIISFREFTHATPEQKIKALGPVLLPYLENKR